MENFITELKQISFFKDLEDEQLILLSSFANKKRYEKDSILFYEKDKPKSLIFLIDGRIKIYKTDAKNNEVIIHRFNPQCIIAEMPLFEGIPYLASAAFETSGAVIEVDFQRFKKEFLNNPDVAFKLFKSLSSKIKLLENFITLNVVLDTTARLAKFIYEHKVELSTLKHYNIAKQLNMTPETLSRTFKKLVVLGLLKKQASGYKIINKNALKVLFE